MKENTTSFKCLHDYGCESPTECKLPSFYEGKDEGRQSKECFVQHIELLLDNWINRLEPKYLPSILRVCKKVDPSIDQDTLKGLINSMLIFHDVGKLTDIYEAGKGVGDFRHEFTSAYVYHLCLQGILNKVNYELKTAAVGAVLLHHEPILMGQVGQIHEEKLTATEIGRRLNGLGKEKAIFLERADETINRFVKRYCRWD
ncbi:MAG: hypothetical protein QXR50_04680, partial [Archaeoglobaceae archaeon]